MSTGTASGVPYHWVIAVQWQALAGYATASVEGNVLVIPDQKRHEVFQHVLGFAKTQVGLSPTSTVTVLFFSLEPDDLPVPALNGAER